MKIMSALLVAASLAAPAGAAKPTPEVLINESQIKWAPAPPTLPQGAKLAVLFGDPGKSGPFTIRLSLPEGYKVPPHWHANDEDLTVISGGLYLGMGDKADIALAYPLEQGGYHRQPAKAPHFVFTKKPTVIQVSGAGPFDIVYLNPAHDPSKKH